MAQRRVKGCILVATEWCNTGVTPELPTYDEFIDLFLDSGVTKEQISNRCKLVQLVEDFTHAESSKLTVNVPKLTNIDQLNTIRNQVKLKDVMLGAML